MAPDSGLTFVHGAMGVNEESAHAFVAATPEELLVMRAEPVQAEAVPARTSSLRGCSARALRQCRNTTTISNMAHDSGLTFVLGGMGVTEATAHAFAARLLREGPAATPEEDLMVVLAEAVPAATMETGNEEEVTLAEWEIRRRSLRETGAAGTGATLIY
ncbi:hypothetical protein HDU86_003513 [Geranomyces michiganensis]|nr:hypothetical protein HDU86_003513 [Geranomyces michiganensis]